jgi:hypothetical protein
MQWPKEKGQHLSFYPLRHLITFLASSNFSSSIKLGGSVEGHKFDFKSVFIGITIEEQK